MTDPVSARERFLELFGVWREAVPFFELWVTDDEVDLVVALDGGDRTAGEVAAALDLGPAAAADLLDRAWRRHVVDREAEDGEVRYRSAGFPARLDHVAKFEAWDELPEAHRLALDRRYFDDYVARNRENVQARMRGEPGDRRLSNDAVLLLAEAEEMVRTASLVAIQPCDCRRLGQRCARPVDVCFLFDDVARAALDRGYGTELGRDEAVERLHHAHGKGLMHTASAGWREHGRRFLCNCCACDCYPFRAAEELGSKGVWPQVRYVAAHDTSLCSHCAICVKRCHFDAFVRTPVPPEIPGKPRKRVHLEAALCWGCGLCATTCPEGAIAMVGVGPRSAPPEKQETE